MGGDGRQLSVDEPAFAAAVADLEPDFVAAAGFSLQDSLAGGVRLAGVERIQPVLVGVQLALTQLWRSYGVAPDAVIGHSMGEVSAAVAAGVLSAAEGLAVIATRSRLMSRLAGRGAMALVELGAEATEAVIADYPQVGVAVYASPRQTVIAGPPEAVDAVIAVVARADRLARRIEVDVASHHRIIDPVLAPLRAALADVSPRAARIPLLSTTTVEGDWTGRVGDADYWVANLRNPVRFTQAVAAAGPHHARFIEVSPHPLLTHAISETLTEHHHHAIPTLVRDTDDTVTFHTNLNAVHTTSPPPTDHPPEPHPTIPTTPWHHTHHWITPPTPQKALASVCAPGSLLGAHITVSSSPGTPMAGAAHAGREAVSGPSSDPRRRCGPRLRPSRDHPRRRGGSRRRGFVGYRIPPARPGRQGEVHPGGRGPRSHHGGIEFDGRWAMARAPHCAPNAGPFGA